VRVWDHFQDIAAHRRVQAVPAHRRHWQAAITELYLRAIEEVVKQGKGRSSPLVPNSRSPRKRSSGFRVRCGNVRVLPQSPHAPSAAGTVVVASGPHPLVVGGPAARLPSTRKLCLIVIDDEHYNSFHQEANSALPTPRDVSVLRARLEDHPDHYGVRERLSSKLGERRRRRVHDSESAEPRRDPPNAVVKVNRPAHDRSDRQGTSGISPSLELAMKGGAQGKGQISCFLQPPRVSHARPLQGVWALRAVRH